MTTLFETLAKKHNTSEGGEHRKSEHKSNSKEHRKESKEIEGKHKEKSKLKYPEMKLEDVAVKVAGGYKFKSATNDDYKDKSKEKDIVSIKLPKMGYIPFVMIPPIDAKNSYNRDISKPMSIKGDPTPKTDDKVESSLDDKELMEKFTELGAHHLKAITTNKKEDHETYHKHAKNLKKNIDNSDDKIFKYRKNIKNAIKQMDLLHKVDKY